MTRSLAGRNSEDMGILAIEDIQPGMVLASDLRTSQGRLLLSSHSTIDAEHLRKARIWGITEADIVGAFTDHSDKDILSNVPPNLRELFEEMLAFRFANCDVTMPPVRRLMELFVLRACTRADGMNERKLRVQYIGPDIRLAEPPKGFSTSGRPALSCQDMLRKEPSLACLPDIFHEVVEASKSPKTSAAHLAEVIGKDQSLSSRLLRLVNSAFYGFASKVDTLPRAVAIVGTVQIANLALGVTVTSVFKGIPADFVDMQAFWEHSIAVGVISRLLGVHMGIPIRERVFVAGLLHDLGRLVIYKNHAEQAQTLMSLAVNSPEPVSDLERKAWGFTHADLGCLLLRQWRIPGTIQDIVAYHHSSGRSKATDEAKLVHLADVIAHSLGFGHAGLRRVPPLCIESWEKVGLPVSALSTLTAQTENQLRDLMRFFPVD